MNIITGSDDDDRVCVLHVSSTYITCCSIEDRLCRGVLQSGGGEAASCPGRLCLAVGG